VELIAATAATAVTAYASNVFDVAHGESDQLRSGAAVRLVSFIEELAARDQEAGAAVTLVAADPTDPARIDLLTRVVTARAEADSVLAERLRKLVYGVEEGEEVRLSIERDLQYAAHQRLVALAVDLGMARGDLETGPADTMTDNDQKAARIDVIREAEQWFRRAADAGSHIAQFNLGVLLGGRGEITEAEQWLRKAASTSDTGLASRARKALDRIQGTAADSGC
jgi:TPR repeat protein